MPPSPTIKRKKKKATASVTPPTRKRRRGRKKHYITGVHHSPKCLTPIHYRSGWEYTVCKALDQNPNVLSYEYESIKIPYLMAGKPHQYYPDFVVRYKSGKILIVEVKRQDKLTSRIVMAKAAAARKWIIEQGNGYCYEFWTDSLIEAFQRSIDIKKK